ncbi:LuxR C-terminal-related transcriptional regulator [Paraconexibacter antarcticus]|uniref:LuxR C-terminal-related transcriptional regulator n=1 Tax=Paraconexibacter antarcticus TaxID=2949664 RepID=A0ABY5DQ57_9ACTN|nr:LuxR C-terminal-related transcriptional regulator [Paraconexibacter antarcticus]UTI63595.1 LuxR C-terminal-related transcriptional regulator [Paraconexibacter antarcticus]
MALATEDTPHAAVAAPSSTQTQAIAALRRAAPALGWDDWSGERAFAGTAAALDALDLAAAVLRRRVRAAVGLSRAEMGELARAAVDLEEARRALRDELLDERHTLLAGVQEALGRLRGIDSVMALLDRATMEVCRSCGFERAVLFRVADEQLFPVSAHFAGDERGADELLEVLGALPSDLDHLRLEAELVRRRMPLLVDDARHDDRVHPVIAEHFAATSYVAAPILPEGRVIGILHADRRGQGREVDAFDRDALAAFAEGFGYALQAATLAGRLRAQRDHVRGMLGSTEQLIDELLDAEIEVSRVDQEDPSRAAHHAATLLDAAPSRLEQLLTPREIDVMRLLAAGETNSGVAARLVITEGTVKSHVKHILRKLRASNRAEAVSRYLRITALDGAE